nr:hypothetical protein [uncultured Desulfuromonas sp.]
MSKTLVKSNRHLRDTTARRRNMARNIESSSAVEGVWVKRDTATGRFVERKTKTEQSTHLVTSEA